MAALNAAIIGVGRFGQRLVNSVQGKSDAICFGAGVTRTLEKAKDFASQRGISLSADYDTVLSDPAIEAVVIASPNSLHVPQTLAAIEAGKHVFTIKPLALNRKDADAARAAAEQAGLVLAMGYSRGFLPGMDELRRRVRAGALGQLLHVEGNFCANRFADYRPGMWKASAEEAPPGILGDHMLYEMVELLGLVAEVHTQGLRLKVQVDIADTTSTLLRFKGGQSGFLAGIGVTADLERLHVFGTEGWGEIRGASRFEFRPVKGKPEVIEFPSFDTERAALEAFAAAVKDERPFPVSLAEIVHSTAVLEAMARSAKEGKPVTVA
ncbi:MAG: Gfo/Idh/MocA family oxidoreductase [Deltaproteobacteria bacterium]|nr:Gfo/Idh/MocA family oxidoreductase [Deltaproteobacteria bacterium]